MQIKKFEAANIKEALRQIKHEFGPEAVILSVKKIENGKGLFRVGKEQGVEVSAATDTLSLKDPKNAIQRKISGYNQVYENANNSFSSYNKGGFISALIKGSRGFDRGKSAPIVKQLGQNKKIKELYNAYCQILEQDVNDSITMELIREICRIGSSEVSLFKKGFKTCLIQVLDQLNISSGRVKIIKDSQQIVAVIGGTGVGKTTTIAKLAAVAKTRETSKRVALITVDDNRIGAIEQLRVYARISDIPLLAAYNKTELMECIRKLSNYDLILVDTPGISQANKTHLIELKELFSQTQNIEFHLALNAATNDKTLNNIIEKFSVFNPNRLIFTKLDECITYGAILNQLFRSRIPVSYFTNGQRIPEDIEAASIPKLVEMIINEGDVRNYLTGSPEKLAQKLNKFEIMVDGSGLDEDFELDLYGVMNSA